MSIFNQKIKYFIIVDKFFYSMQPDVAIIYHKSNKKMEMMFKKKPKFIYFAHS